MTERQSNIVTVRLAWDLYFPGSPELPLPHVCAWLNNADVDTIVDNIQKTADDHKRKQYRNPAQVCWSRIRPKRCDVLKFDEQGQKIA